MKAKEKFEIIFICLLILIGGGLLYIYFADLDGDSYIPKNVKELFSKNNFAIIDKIEDCSGGREEFYTDEEYIYYFECNKSKLVYVEYDDGTIKPMMDELNNGNISIGSLINHGLKCSKQSLLEENETELNETNETDFEVEDAQENQTTED